MLRALFFLCVCGIAGICLSEEIINNLPQSHYQQIETDPSWLKTTVQLHGHLGPMVSFGARMGMAALRAVDAKGYFDVEVICEGPFANPPASCFLDGVQIATGATMGKRNLHWIDSKAIVVRVKNTQTGKTVTLTPQEKFLALLPQPKKDGEAQTNNTKKSRPGDDHSNDDLSRKIAVMPERDILAITYQRDD
jgi:formylmethanofuran dehydrogenase subunit E